MTATLLRRPQPPRPDLHWWEQAACRNRNPDWWTTAPSREITHANRKAITICRTCPVWQQCLLEAIDHRDICVIRGGHIMPKGPQAWTDRSRRPEHITKLIRYSRSLR